MPYDKEKARSEYSQKLRDPRWQKMRLEVMQRDNFTCQECGDKDKTLNVHHLYYSESGDPWDISPHALRTLCESCHECAARVWRPGGGVDGFMDEAILLAGTFHAREINAHRFCYLLSCLDDQGLKKVMDFIGSVAEG